VNSVRPLTTGNFAGCLPTAENCLSADADIFVPFLCNLCLVCCVLRVKMFQRRLVLVSTEKKYTANEELLEILRNGSDEEYVEDKGRR
jgi:hypothetical protein